MGKNEEENNIGLTYVYYTRTFYRIAIDVCIKFFFPWGNVLFGQLYVAVVYKLLNKIAVSIGGRS